MRITYLGINYSPEPTGIAPYAATLTRSLAAAGHQVSVVTGFPHYPQWRVAEGFSGSSRRSTEAGVRVLRLNHYVPRRPSLVRRALMELSFGVRAVFSRWSRPEAIVVATPALLSAALVLLRARLAGVPAVVWVQDIYTLGLVQTAGPSRAERLLRRLESWAVGSPAAVVAIHDRFRSFLVGQLGADAGTVAVIRNWTHLPGDPPGRSEEFRARHGWRPDDVVVLHAGNMGAKQGLENVVAAARLAGERGSTVRFVLLGDGNQRAALEQLGGGPRLQFIPPLPDEDFQLALSSADVLLVNELPGLTEMSVPSKLTSYFNTGLPVLGAVDEASVTAAELAAAGGAVRVDAAAPAALLEAAEQLGSDRAAALALGARNREFKDRQLSQAAAVAAFERILQSVRTPRSR